MIVTSIAQQHLYRVSCRNLLISMALLLILLTNSCAVKPPIVPPLTQDSNAQRLVGKFVWFDLFVQDLDAVAPFYQELFGWSFVSLVAGKDSVKTIYRNGLPIGNVVERSPGKEKNSEPHWLGYLSVENADIASQTVTNKGGTVQMEPKDLPNRGRVAVIDDPQGAHVALVASSHGDPLDTDEIDNLWVGGELWTTSIDAALDFYTVLFDYEVEIMRVTDDTPYTALFKNDELRAGVVKIPWEQEVEPLWIPYIAVKDVLQIIKKANDLGGIILTDADPAAQETPNAIIADPQGAVFGVVEISEEQP